MGQGHEDNKSPLPGFDTKAYRCRVVHNLLLSRAIIAYRSMTSHNVVVLTSSSTLSPMLSILLGVIENIGKVAFSTVLTCLGG